MDINFIRSSSANTWESYCQHKYFLVYNLGLEDPPNIKTEKGTIVHAVLEILAGMKKTFQEKGEYSYEHQGIGLYKCPKYKFLKPYQLSNEEIDLINKSRINKNIYVDQAKVEYGLKRYGVEVVEDLLNKCYDYYSNKSIHDWSKSDRRDCLNFVWMVLDWGNGNFDPRKRSIIYPELPFNIKIEKDWAKLNNGDYLRIKGTIDLVTDLGNGVVECVDYKTGARYDWGSGKEKTYEDLLKDPQLMLYYYALRKSLPEYHSIMFTIFFIRDGGPFTLAFDDDVIEKVENNLRKTFEEIKNTQKPILRDPTYKQFQCNKLCGFYKKKIGDNSVCSVIANSIDVYGIEKTTQKYRRDGFSIDKYQNPGE